MIDCGARVAKQYCGLVMGLVTAVFLLSCASPHDKRTSGEKQFGRLSATGYTEFGCLINLRDEARERSVRLKPNDFEVSQNMFSWLFPMVDREGYQCSGSILPPRPPTMGGDTSLYPVN